ncbi:MAG: 4-carboxymuconolactone decarboxylase /3-oxoadipate enol-lactonase [Frankiales bacterium]|nr:4-carboxymuconolactone decarboxylase /3-oxoadipate enol-lactonase [Frankiales bacterium]
MTVPLAYEIDGPDGAPVIVLLNSLGTSTAMWKWQIGPLAEQFRVLRIDTRGHGRSPSDPSPVTTVEDLGGDVLAVLDVLGIGRAHLAAVSLGGVVAMWLAAHHPQRVGRLALLCTSAHPGNPQGWRDRAAAARASGMASIADAVARRWITPELAERDPGLIEFLQQQLLDTDAETFAQCCDLLAGLDLRPELQRITARTLVVGADHDQALPMPHSQAVADGISDAKLVEIGPAGHLAPVELPAAITGLLADHFAPASSLEEGFAMRRAVLSDRYVDAAIAGTTPFTADFQQLITSYAWGTVWTRPGLARRERSITSLAVLVTLGAERELATHIRGALRNGLAQAEIGEILMHTAIYAGVPRAMHGFAIAQRVFTELDAAEEN